MSRSMYKVVVTFLDKEPEISYYATADETIIASQEAKEKGAIDVTITSK